LMILLAGEADPQHILPEQPSITAIMGAPLDKVRNQP
jgi:hypothetical protein